MLNASMVGVHSGTVLDRAGGFSVISCDRCGFKHLIPVPEEDYLARLYQDYYREGENRNPNGQDLHYYIREHEEDADWWAITYDRIYDEWEGRVGPERRTALDYGCGPGFFAKHGMERGWRVIGYDTSERAVKYAKDLGVTIVSHETLYFLNYTVDAINLYETLEHLPHPADTLKFLKQKLSPGGIITVTVPNDYNPLQNQLSEKFGHRKYWLVPPYHVNYFDAHSLERLLEKCGFSVVHKTTSFPMELFLLLGFDYTKDNAVGREMHHRRCAMERKLDKKYIERLYRSLCQIGLGREVTIHATKN